MHGGTPRALMGPRVCMEGGLVHRGDEEPMRVHDEESTSGRLPGDCGMLSFVSFHVKLGHIF